MESDQRCSDVECTLEFVLCQVKLVVDLHFLVMVDLGLDTSLEVLELELSSHVGAGVRCVADEARLDERARVRTGRLKVVDNEDGVVSKLAAKNLESIFSWSSFDEINVRSFDLGNSPTERFACDASKGFDDLCSYVSLVYHPFFSFS